MIKSLKSAVLLGLATATVAAPTVASAAPLSTWFGRYSWEQSLGRIGGSAPGEGIAAFVTYRLTLGAAAGPSGCTLTGEGYQTYEQMQCAAMPQGNSVVIKYYNFRAGAPGRYAQGAPLFTMTRTNRGIVTRLQALSPASDMSPRNGRMFRRLV